MSGKKIIEYISLKGKEINIESEKPSNMVYISGCENCTFLISKQVAKVFIERSTGCKLELRAKIMSSLVEVYICRELTFVSDPLNALNTITIESSSGVVLQSQNPNQLTRIVIMNCQSLKYCLVHPYPLENIPDLVSCIQGRRSLDRFEDRKTQFSSFQTCRLWIEILSLSHCYSP